jgi:serine/threonine protein kinase
MVVTRTSALERVAEGREAEIYAWEPGKVLRLFREHRDLAAIEREVAAMEAGRASMQLVPAVFGITIVDGRPGMIMERIDGPDLLTLIGRKPWRVWEGGRINGATQARLHDAIAPAGLPTVKQRITRLVSGPAVPPHIAGFALRHLEQLPDGDRLCHGDLHPANILLSSRGPIVIDWPNATRGDPHADLARTYLTLRIGSPPPGSPPLLIALAKVGRRILILSYLRAYRKQSPCVDMALMRRWMIVRAADRLSDGIPDERATLLGMLERAAS